MDELGTIWLTSVNVAHHLWLQWARNESIALQKAANAMEEAHEALHQASVLASLPGPNDDEVDRLTQEYEDEMVRAVQLAYGAAHRLGVHRELVWGVVAASCAHYHEDLDLWTATVRGWEPPLPEPDPNQGYH